MNDTIPTQELYLKAIFVLSLCGLAFMLLYIFYASVKNLTQNNFIIKYIINLNYIKNSVKIQKFINGLIIFRGAALNVTISFLIIIVLITLVANTALVFIVISILYS